MRKAFFALLIITMLTCCGMYHKVDFIVDNYGIDYLDSIHNTGRTVKLQYPSDAFSAARPFLQKTYGRNYKKFKPYIIEIVDDSLWAVWTNPNFKKQLTGRGRYQIHSEGICISMYDGKIKSYKTVK